MSAEPVADLESLPGRDLHDALGRKLGEIQDVIEGDEGDGDEPQWVTVTVKPGAFGSELVIVPLARIKEEDERLEVPYSERHVLDAPRPEDPASMSDEDKEELLTYYAVERGDQPDVESYSTQGTQEVDIEEIEEPVGDPEDGGHEGERSTSDTGDDSSDGGDSSNADDSSDGDDSSDSGQAGNDEDASGEDRSNDSDTGDEG